MLSKNEVKEYRDNLQKVIDIQPEDSPSRITLGLVTDTLDWVLNETH